MNYKTDFPKHFDLFMDRMYYVNNEYDNVMEWRKPNIWIWKTMWQYFFSFMQEFISECKANWIDPMNREQVYNYFDNFTREPNVRYCWKEFRENKINDKWEMVLSQDDKKLCDIY